MIEPALLLRDGAILCVVLGGLVIGSFYWKPRMYLRDFPGDISESASPMTEAETRLSNGFGLLVVGIMVGIMVWSASEFGPERGVLLMILHAYLLFQIFNVFDVLMDWVLLARIDPAHPPIAGTEHAPGWRNYGFHAVKALKGSVLGLPVAALAGGFASFWQAMV